MEQLTDYTINGECSGCGRCCTNILPLSQKEIQKIKSYIGQYKVTPVNRNNVLTKEYSKVCPFLSKENKCNIYKVRPEICRRFICSKFKNNEKAFNYSDKRNINMLSTFFSDEMQIDEPDIKELDKIFQINKRKMKVY